MLLRLGLGILISLLIHFWIIGKESLFQFPEFNLATFPVSMELSLTVIKHPLEKSESQTGKSIETIKKITPDKIKLKQVILKKHIPIESTAQQELKKEKKKHNYTVKTSMLPTPAKKGVRRARLLPGQEPPAYPMIARYRHLEGTVLLAVEVLPDGKCGRIVIKNSSGSAILDKAAAEGVKKWVFEPALKEGKKVSSEIEIPVVFDLQAP